MPMLEGLPLAELVAPGAYDAEVLAAAAELGTPIAQSTESQYPGWVGVAVTADGLAGAVEDWMDQLDGGIAVLP